MGHEKPSLSLSVKKRVRMRDVATRCGLSISTVSLVLSGDARIPEDTTRKVLQAVKAMEYRPSILARSLARRGSRTIGVILPEFAFQKNQGYFYQALQGIHSETQPAGYKMLVEAASRGFLERRYYLRLLKEQSADGIVYLAANSGDSFLSDMVRENYPFVLLGNTIEQTGLPAVIGEDAAGAALATQHLISLGHTAIAHLAGTDETSSGLARQKGYRDAMSKAGLVVQPHWIISGDFDIRTSEKMAVSLIESKCTAVFAANDTMAYGLIKGLAAQGVRVPDDMAVVGMEDLELSSWINPPLTTVRLDITGMAAQATRTVLNALKNTGVPKNVDVQTFAPQLIKRISCGSKS